MLWVLRKINEFEANKIYLRNWRFMWGVLNEKVNNLIKIHKKKKKNWL